MTIDVAVPRSRRALLAGGIGGIAALVAGAIGRPLRVSAADGEIVLVGGEYESTSVTKIAQTTSGATAIEGTSGSGTGVEGWSGSGTGVVGKSSSYVGVNGASDSHWGVSGFSALGGVLGYSMAGLGVAGRSNGGRTGVLGFSGTSGDTLPSGPMRTGVYGYAAQDASSIGTQGESVAGIGVRGTSTTGDGVVGSTVGSGKSGVYGYTTVLDGFGIFGRNKWSGATGALGAGLIGVRGTSPAASGVVGSSGSASPPVSTETGVHGYAIQSATARGVHGQTTIGRGVEGRATSGVGLYGHATTGYALRAVGRVKLDKCAGVATIVIGKSSITVTPGIDLTSTSAVVATLQGSAGGTTTVHRCIVNTSTNTFTIHLTKAATQNVKVAWHVFG